MTYIALLLVVLFSVSAFAVCPEGTVLFRGNCAADLAPVAGEPVEASEEKAPKDKMPSYQREGVHVDMPQSQVAADSKADQDKAAAIAQGKAAAGVPATWKYSEEKTAGENP